MEKPVLKSSKKADAKASAFTMLLIITVYEYFPLLPPHAFSHSRSGTG